MKTNKLYLLALLLLPFSGFSQNGFIEIEVVDSVQVKARSYEYTIVLDEAIEVALEDDADINEMKSKNKEKMKLNDLENYLKKNKYKYVSLDEANLNSSRSRRSIYLGNGSGFKVTVTTPAELKKLANEVKEMPDIDASISNINYESKSIYEDELLRKLIEKGKAKAQSIAKISNMALGKIIEIKEVRQNEDSNYNFMEMLMKLDRRRTISMMNNLESIGHSKAIIMKFRAD